MNLEYGAPNDLIQQIDCHILEELKKYPVSRLSRLRSPIMEWEVTTI